jgi:tryptophanyl-tRNA synthetase
MASDEQVQTMKSNYLAGGYGYGHAKKALLELILDNFAEERKRFDELMANPVEIDLALEKGAQKARPIARATVQRVREKLGLRLS